MQDESIDADLDASILLYLPRERIKACYTQAPGDELRVKFISPESSAALVANCSGLFLEKAELLEGLPGGPPSNVLLESELRFPWAGGRHPYLDVLIESEGYLTGVESKRFEPFRSHGPAEISPAYKRPVWGKAMGGYEAIRDLLLDNPLTFRRLDAAQLIKHALGLRMAVNKREADHCGKNPVLLYLYAEPTGWPDNRPISQEAHEAHRQEIGQFIAFVAGNEVEFRAMTYRTLLEQWDASASIQLRAHAHVLRERFRPW